MNNLFRITGRVSRNSYWKVGLALMALKYCVEAAFVYVSSGVLYPLTAFFGVSLRAREPYLAGGPSWIGVVWVVWTLVFIWIAVAMSFRRSRDSMDSPWLALAILVPTLNWCVMLYLGLRPTRAEVVPESGDWRSSLRENSVEMGIQSRYQAAITGIVVGAVYLTFVVVLGTTFFQNYGAALFLGAPGVAGAACGYTFNRKVLRSTSETIQLALVMMGLSMCAFLLIGYEGLICIVMAAFPMVVLAAAGALFGRWIAADPGRGRPDRGFACSLALVPILMFIETKWVEPATYEVQSHVVIDAPIEAVWDCVVAFPEITAPAPWYFRAGIAMPVRARIEGSGVGAIRYCEFTTGSFVEPITVWEPPTRLGFDVTEQPDPMVELTPYHSVHPPHLQSSFRSQRGEFRLVALPDGRTRLEGSTWYRLGIHPDMYWTVWTDWVVHRIHMRVLEHIQSTVEG